MTEVEGEECFELTGDIKGDTLTSLMDEEMMSSFGLDVLADEDVMADVTIPCTVEVYKDSILPARLNIDMKEVMESILEESGEDVEVSDYFIEMIYAEYDSVDEITVPDEAKEAVSDSDAGKDVKEDNKDTGKKASAAKQSEELEKLGQLYGSDQ